MRQTLATLKETGHMRSTQADTPQGTKGPKDQRDQRTYYGRNKTDSKVIYRNQSEINLYNTVSDELKLKNNRSAQFLSKSTTKAKKILPYIKLNIIQRLVTIVVMKLRTRQNTKQRLESYQL